MIEHIVSPASAGWVGWTMLALLLCAILSEVFQPGIVSQALSSLTSHNERTYKESPDNFPGQLFITLFRIGTVAMSLCLCTYHDGVFSFVRYGTVCGLVAAMLLVKMPVNLLLTYTFALPSRMSSVYEHYGNIATLAVIALYPVLLVLLRYGTTTASLWVFGVSCGLFILMWLYRSWTIFVNGPAAAFYEIIYILTLEILPLAALYYSTEKLISDI